MANQSPPPELVEVYHLLKAGQRVEAARRLKAYLPQHRSDADAWWLLAHAVPQVEYQRHCLEEVLRLRPNDARARAWLDRLSPADPTPPTSPPDLPPTASAARPPAASAVPDPSPPAPTPGAVLDEPDDMMILGLEPRHTTPIPPRPPTGPLPPLTRTAPPAAPAKPQEPPSFEEFAAHLDVDLPLPDDDPFGSADAAPSAAPALAAVAPDPIGSASLFDPAAHARLRPAPRVVQAGGTGNQPLGGPGLAYVSDAAAPPAPLAEDVSFETDRQRERANVERMIGRALIAFAAIVLLGIVLVAAASQGWLKLGADRHVPKLATLDGGSFTVKYPEGYDTRCEHEASGYPVCGVANHPLYNEVDYFVGKQVDLGALISQSVGLFGAGEVPEEQFSIIVMDVPSTSPAYDDRSWAKTKYEWNQELADGGWWFDENAAVDYERQEVTVAGHAAYYYRYISEGQWRDAAWDLYVPHDGITLWLRIVYTGERQHRLPRETVAAMIESLELKPVAEW